MSQHGCPERLSNRSKGFQEDGASQPTMEVLVETLTGTAFEMTVSPSDTIFAIKSKICRVEGIPVSQQHLLYNLTELEDGMSLRALGIADGARLRLVLGMRGGPISTRRLPPPPGEPWRDIERLLDSNRDEGWSGGGSGSGSGCKVTVLVFRDGERVNMLRVRENRDGSYSPIEHTKYVSDAPSLSHAAARPATEQSGALQQNAVTQGKMLDLRRRMESLSVRRRVDVPGEKPEIQKTRSEETLSVPSLLDDGSNEPFNRTYTPYSEAEDTFTPLYDGNYTRYEYDCSFADRYTLLPPIGTRTDSEQSIQEESDRLKLSDALAGSILVKGRREREDEAILEECLEGVEECHIRQDSPQLAAKNLAPIPAAEYGAVVGGSGSGSGAGSGSGSGSWLGALGGPPAHAHSASSLHVRARNTHSHPHTHTHAHAHAHPHARVQPLPLPLADALFSSSTSDLEKLRRNRILPTLSRHRNREHLHLSDEGLDRHEPRHIHNIAEMDSRLFRFGDLDHGHKEPQPEPQPAEHVPEITQDTTKDKKIRIRCGFCRKRLSIATVHRCRCGAVFCAPHRYAEVHGCAYDYKAAALKALAQANPLVSAPKLPKI